MSLRTLRTLIQVARKGTFAAVTEVRGLTQAAVSLPMKGLEEALGAELFDRTGRGMRLNAEGGLALRCAKEIPSLYAGVREEMDPEGGVRGVS